MKIIIDVGHTSQGKGEKERGRERVREHGRLQMPLCCAKKKGDNFAGSNSRDWKRVKSSQDGTLVFIM